ncbi:hypothetical protein Psta_3896 [Pirellula staleyi DSM 6068]|uniref:Uncharacterized protein n=1 Tax=Pirellula staleyi (strain ATCC 27377 / DSM 6068 / ICPB 4128) TaxID=530564 RepID=D2R165_PIRSD|nr:hypothetical protein Psta_3896 [Pirellula staleyi DSM 6068]
MLALAQFPGIEELVPIAGLLAAVDAPVVSDSVATHHWLLISDTKPLAFFRLGVYNNVAKEGAIRPLRKACHWEQ